jgi:hypothetical protein
MTTKRKPRSPSEDQIHVACAQWLERQWPQSPPELVKRHGVRWISHELRNAKSRVEGAKRKDRGCRAGDPDIELIYGRVAHFLELKTSKGSLSDAQIDERARILAAGGFWALCRSPDDLISQLHSWGFPIRGEAPRHVQEPVI